MSDSNESSSSPPDADNDSNTSSSSSSSPSPNSSSPSPQNAKSPPNGDGSGNSTKSLPPQSPPPSSPPPSSPPPSNSTETSSPPPSKSPQTPPPPSPPSPTPSTSPAPSSNSTIPADGGSKNISHTPAVSKSPPSPIISPPRQHPIHKVSPPTDDYSSPADSGSNHASKSRGSSSSGQTGTFIGVAVAGVFLIALVAMIFVVMRRKKRADMYNNNMPPAKFSEKSEGYYPSGHGRNQSYRNSADGHMGGQPRQSSNSNVYGSQRYHAGGGSDSEVIRGRNPHFSYEEMMEITNGFSHQNILGEGGFGCVFKGWLADGREVAVKQLKAGSGQGEREFRAEVDIISRVHHRYLVSLVGYCISENHRLLIYEFVSNKTLEYHLHGNEAAVLDWPKRLKIALEAAKGLAYLHEDCHPKIIHRDIKSANILLDNAYVAKVADFGLAKLSSDTNTHVSTRVMGTFGYMAPEYASSGKLTDRSDVFSFGVVLLELLTGRKPVDPSQPLGDESLVEWARPLLIRALQTGDLSELIDPRLQKHYMESEIIRMIEAAAACVRHSAPKRPRMMQVVRALDCEGESSDLSNGMKYGESIIYDSGQYNQEIMRFRTMAVDSKESSEYDAHSGEYSREFSGPENPWNNTPGSELDSRNFASGRHPNLQL